MATELEYGTAKVGALDALAKFLNAAAELVTFFRKELEREAAEVAARKGGRS